MKYILYCTLSLIVLGAVTLVTGSSQAQTTAPGPYYATPSWDQTIACTTTANCPRFIVLSNMGGNAVLDRETGLVWEKSPSTSTFPWTSGTATTAGFHCNELTVGNRLGWRLPTIQELASLVDPSVAVPGPRLPPGHPFTGVQSSQGSGYWSATTDAIDTNFAWFVDFRFGNTNVDYDFTDKGVSLFVWCVLGGQGSDPQ